jgi:phenylacetate-CoA ligase
MLALYHALPYPLRCAAASARGLYLSWWRYGPETDAEVAATLERDTWPAARWDTWTAEELAKTLHHAAKHVPWYRDHWSNRRRHGDRASVGHLENWPILRKEDLRTHPRAFLSDTCNLRRMMHVHTSGTTGTPISIRQSRRTVQRRYALMEARWRQWYGVSRHDRWAILGGQLVTPYRQTERPYWVWNAGLRQLYMSTIHLSDASIQHYHAAITRSGIRYIWGYSSALHALARGLLHHEFRLPGVEPIITNTEPVLVYQHDDIAKAFSCPIVETYGMTEAVLSASQCQYGSMHLWPESGILETHVESKLTLPGQTGEFIATGLNNPDMPFIRYATGDGGALAQEGATRACGRSLPLLAFVSGRNDGEFRTPDPPRRPVRRGLQSRLTHSRSPDHPGGPRSNPRPLRAG